MKCISLWQPWATLIIIGAKHYETRSWWTSYRGPLLIHASKKLDEDSLSLCLDEPFRSALVAAGIQKIGDLPRGFILGQVQLADCLRSNGRLGRGDPYILQGGTQIGYPEQDFGDFSVGRFAFHLTNFKRFQTPIPLRAFQGIFNVPDELVAEQLAKAVAA